MKLQRRQRGQSMVEFVLMLPILLIILLGLLDLGRLWYAYVAVTDAAAEGATYAAINPPTSDDDISQICQRAQDASGGLVQIDPDAVDVELVSSGSSPSVIVTVDYTFTLATPLLHAIVPEGHLLLRSRANEVILSGQLP
ncbi:MAG: pilus assembly protein [Anaerolineales bacterium]|nr:pilus assembly protein [Anaerolineales bacterium]